MVGDPENVIDPTRGKRGAPASSACWASRADRLGHFARTSGSARTSQTSPRSASQSTYLRTRFFAARLPPDAVIERLLHIDYLLDHVAWVASESAAPDARPLGIARFIVSGDDKAEIAISIIDACQGKGLGRLLVARSAASRRQ